MPIYCIQNQKFAHIYGTGNPGLNFLSDEKSLLLSKPKNENKNPCSEKSWFEFLEWWEEFLLAHHRSRWIGPTPPWGISKMIDPCKHMYGFNEFVLGHGQIYSR